MATPTTRLKLKKQALSENLNTWGLSNGINGVIDQVDVLAGYLEVDLGTSTSYTFGTTNYSVAGNEHAYRAVKFTGTPASGVTVNIPAVDDFKFIENATGQTITFSNGSTTATLANTFTGYLRTNGSSSITVLVLPDGVNIQTVANDINNVNLVAGQISPTNNIAALGNVTSDITTVANPTYKALVEVVGEATYKALVEVVGETNYKALVEVVGESVYKSLVETVGNATYKALVETVGETTYKALVETVGESVYKSVVETVGEAVYKAKVETVADATYKSQIEALNDVTYKAQLQDIATSPYKPLVETVGNATYKALVEVVGESTYKALVETVGNATYKAVVETVGESVYKGKVETVAGISNEVQSVANAEANGAVSAFGTIYQVSTNNPTARGNGTTPLVAGDLAYVTSVNKLRTYNASLGAWEDAGSAVSGLREIYQYVATANQTVFPATGNIAYDQTAGGAAISVYLNGVLLKTTDYTATNGTSITLATGAAVNDEVSIHTFGSFNVSDTYSRSAADARFVQPSGNVATATTATNVAGGQAQGILYQSAASTTAHLAAGTTGQFLQTNGSGSAPTWVNAPAGSSIASTLKFA